MTTMFDPARSAALRRQLGALPATDLQPDTVLPQHRGHPTELADQPGRPAIRKHRRAPWAIGGAGLAVTAGLLASGPFQPASTTGADFVPAMARPQQPEDLLPEDLRRGDMDSLPGLVVSTSRLVGTERGYNYYAAESNDGMMCLVIAYPPEPPDPEATRSPWEVACTPLTNFDSSPLQITSASTNTKIWLVSANIEPTEEQLTQLTRLSPNLYIEYTDGIPLSPAREAGHDL
ncbi:hypothetical protein [Arthrobacter antioxidans]|uniref:hypothetical protein n=1 Tax=Arthrobacter antioxidans TaxID=2895818 RepID=UPI001FFF6EE2|nr:hypothetical protein [Arthrobacter antioxidans]